MRKRVVAWIAAILALVLCLGLLPFNVWAASESDLTITSNEGLCPHCGVKLEEITWETWTAIADPASGHYRLEEDIQANRIQIGNAENLDADICLDLNGYTWKGNHGEFLMNIGVASESSIKFAIMDSVGGGEMQATGRNDEMAVLKVGNSAQLTLYSGTIRQLYAKDISTLYGVVYVNNATFQMHGGVITDGYTTAEPSNGVVGGNVVLRNNAIMNMDGGLITNGYSKMKAGGVAVVGSAFYMSGGTISGNITEGDGGNLYANNTASTFVKISDDAVIKNGVAGGQGANIYNGSATNATVLENVSGIDGDIYTAANMTLTGKVSIPMGNSNGLLIANGKKLSLVDFDAASEVYFGVELAAGASAVFTAEGTVEYLDCFKNVGRTTAVVAEGGALMAARISNSAEQESWCPHCDQKVTWYRSSAMTSGTTMQDYTHFFYNSGLTQGIALDTDEVVFDMCGMALTSSKQMFSISSANTNLSILDTVGGGVITGKGASSGTGASSNGGVINVSGTGTTASVTLYSGKLALAAAPNGFVLRGGVIAMNSGTLNIKGGIIADGQTTHASTGGAGGNIYLQNTVLNMSGGLVTNGTARLNGGNIYLNSNACANITGGMIAHGTATNRQGGNIASFYTGSETNHISNVVLRGGVAGTVGGNIGIEATAKYELNNVVLAGGSANEGGNLAVVGASCTATDCMIYGGLASVTGTNNITGAENLSIIGGKVEETPEEPPVEPSEPEEPPVEPSEPEEPPVDMECPHCGVHLSEITWNTWDGSANPATGHYRLRSDLTTNHTNIGNGTNLDADVVLDLNGKVWSASEGDYLIGAGFKGGSDSSAWVSSIKLSILDSVGGGALEATGKADHTGVVTLTNGTQFDLYSGTIRLVRNESYTPMYGVVYVNGSTFNMHGGKIADGYNVTNPSNGVYGANVLLRGAATVMTMTGGEITGGYSAYNAGGINAVGGTFTMTGGKIYNNTAEGTGDNLAIGSAFGNVTIGGTAEISGGDIACSGNMTINGGTIDRISNKAFRSLTISGAPVIKSLAISAGKTITLGELTAGAEVWINAEGVFTEETAKAAEYAAANYFKTSVAGATIVANGNALEVMKAEDPICPHCGVKVSEITWEPWDGTSPAEGAHYRMESDLSTGTMRFGTSVNNNSFALDLNGYVWSSVSGNLMDIGTVATTVVVSIMDLAGGGEMQAYGKANDAGVISVQRGATLKLYGGTIRQLRSENVTTLLGAVYIKDATFDMYGGTITGGYNTSNPSNGVYGANVLLRGATAVMTMSGGEITGGYSAYNAGGVHAVGGTFTMTGGKIYGNTADGKGGNMVIGSAFGMATIGGTAQIIDGEVTCNNSNLTLSDAPVIKDLTIAAGKIITLGDLTAGAEVWVNAEGVFTAETEKAAEYANYFNTNVEGKTIVVAENALAVEEGKPEPQYLTFTLNEDGESYSVTDCDQSASGEMIIPSTYNGKPVTTIGQGAFYNCQSLTSVTIPDSVTTIWPEAFADCDNLTSVTIPDSVTTIGWSAFWGCDNLTSVNIPNSVTEISSGVFSGCSSLTSVTIPDSVTTIAVYAFLECENLASVTIGAGVTNIGDLVFDKCPSLSDVYYNGTEEQRQNISIGSGNEPLLSATWHYAEESYIAGDFTGDDEVNNEDVIYLLWHTMFPENYPVESQADFTGDGKVNNEDVIYLLWHIMFPESYPLTDKNKLA